MKLILEIVFYKLHHAHEKDCRMDACPLYYVTTAALAVASDNSTEGVSSNEVYSLPSHSA
jgi:hypothetical protein